MNSPIECILAVHCRPRLTSLTALKETYLFVYLSVLSTQSTLWVLSMETYMSLEKCNHSEPNFSPKDFNMDTNAFATSRFIQLDLVLDRTSERLYFGKILQLNFFECFFGTDDQKLAAKFCVLGVFLSSCHPWQLHSVGLEALRNFLFLD